MQWLGILDIAAEAAGARLHLAQLAALISAALEGQPELQLVADVLGYPAIPDPGRDGEDPDPPFLTAVDAACYAHNATWSERELACVRVVLRELAPWLDAAGNLLYGGTLPSFEPDALPAVLARMEHGVTNLPAEASGDLRCPRCNCGDVGSTYSDATESRLVEVSCRACGLYDSWTDHNPANAARWLTT